MKRLIIVLLIMVLTSCEERIVQLPETGNNKITEVLDVSPIYIFYNEETGEAEFNRANMIGTTNWLVNIDKRLTLKQILPHLQYLQEKRNKGGMHKNEEARNYFTCSNLDIENLAFIDFTELQFIDEMPTNIFEETPLNPSDKSTFLNFNSVDDVSIYDSSGNYHISKPMLFVLNYLEDLDIKHPIVLSFSNEITFQGYISAKTALMEIKNEKLELANKEFIYN